MKSADATTSNVVPLPRRPAPRDAATLEFLPAALEVVETPASPAGRAIAGTIIAFFCIAIAWACIGKVDIIATAQGKVVPAGRVKLVQPLEPGIVAGIHVQDGDHVTAGQVLVELDRTETTADRDKIAGDLMKARLDVARLSALRKGFEAHSAPAGFATPADAPAADVDRARAAMAAQAAEQAAKIASLKQQIAEKEGETQETNATIAKLQASLPWSRQQAETLKKAVEMEVGSKLQFIDAEQKLVEQEHDLVVQQRHLSETVASTRALERQVEETRAEYGSKILADLADAEQKAAETGRDLVKAEQKTMEQVLRAPVDGTVQQVAVHTVGGVVTPAQQLMVVVPQGSSLEIEAMVSNRDIGFVHPGQDAEVKVDTFNFTKYGLLHGMVTSLSRDAIAREAPPDPQGREKPQAALSDSSEPKGQELVYAARIRLDRTAMEVDGKLVSLEPGMAVTAEIKTGRRRVIEYILSPLLRYREESLQER